jgi:hypothetical protein
MKHILRLFVFHRRLLEGVNLLYPLRTTSNVQYLPQWPTPFGPSVLTPCSNERITVSMEEMHDAINLNHSANTEISGHKPGTARTGEGQALESRISQVEKENLWSGKCL